MSLRVARHGAAATPPRGGWRRLVSVGGVLAVTVAQPGCGNLGYYSQSAGGQLEIMVKSRSIETLLSEGAVSEELERKLRLVLDIRRFASAELGLPDNASYRRYADLGRRYVVWNVFATPELSMQPVEWCFVVVGCVAYRGYFDPGDAELFAVGRRERGDDVYVAGIRAYSTLGWFTDPVLNTVIEAGEVQLAALVFHELAHQVVYVKGDTTFNESFATAVEHAGVKQWLERRYDGTRSRDYAERIERERRTVELLLEFKTELDGIYASNRPDDWKRSMKTQTFTRLKAAYRELSRDWPEPRPFDAWFGQTLNNAHLVSIGAYHELVPAFEALLRRHGNDFPGFYNEVRDIGALDEQGRRERLDAAST